MISNEIFSLLLDDRLDGGERRGDREGGGGLPRLVPPKGGTPARAAHGGTGRHRPVAGDDAGSHANRDEGHVPSGRVFSLILSQIYVLIWKFDLN